VLYTTLAQNSDKCHGATVGGIEGYQSSDFHQTLLAIIPHGLHYNQTVQYLIVQQSSTNTRIPETSHAALTELH